MTAFQKYLLLIS